MIDYCSSLAPLCDRLIVAGGRPVLVGGVVRDFLRARVLASVPAPTADIDIEVFGLLPSALEAVLSPFGATLVGRSFGVYKLRLDGMSIDVSLPRRERHRSAAHNDVDVVVDADMTFAEAASRRDFTVNAMGFDWVSQTFLDPFGGMRDMHAGVIRHVGAAFIEDPLRVFRAARFAVRFGYTIAPETVALCQTMDLQALSRERVWEELVRLMDYDAGVGLSWYRHLGCLAWYPELAALVGVPQDPVHHPEGDAWVHTCLVLSAMGKVPVPAEFRLELQLAALCHDLGKSVTTAWRSGRWRALGHEHVGAGLTRKLLSRIGCPLELKEKIVSLVKCHMLPTQLHLSSQRTGVSDTAIRRLACKVSIEKLLCLATADHNGRGQIFDPQPPAVVWLETRASLLSVYRSAPTPWIQGRDLIAVGVAPGPQMGQLLDRLFQAQLRGVFSTKEEGLFWLRRFMPKGQSH